MDARTGRRADDSPPYRVSLVDPGEIAAALPLLLGFRPRESVVLVSLTGPRGVRVGLTVRADIPPPEHAAAVAGMLAQSVRTDRPAAVLLVVVSEAPDDGDEDPDLPHRALVHELIQALHRDRLPVRDALLVRAGRWWSYDCPSACCRPERGTPLPEGTSELAVASVAAGVVVADSREELAARIASRPGDMGAVARRVAAEAAARFAGTRRATRWRRSRGRRSRPGWPHARAGTALSDRALARILWGLRDIAVRDRALLLALDEDPAVDSLWTECVRRAPRRYVPPRPRCSRSGRGSAGTAPWPGWRWSGRSRPTGRYRLAVLLRQALTRLRAARPSCARSSPAEPPTAPCPVPDVPVCASEQFGPLPLLAQHVLGQEGEDRLVPDRVVARASGSSGSRRGSTGTSRGRRASAGRTRAAAPRRSAPGSPCRRG